MKTEVKPNAGERGTAIVVVLAVLVLILAFMAGNNATLRSLHREVQLIEQRQLRKYRPSSTASGTLDRTPPVTVDAPMPVASVATPPPAALRLP